MADQRRSKKTDKIEVRLAPETKQAFHETCEQQGESASGVIRRLIEEYVARFHQPMIARPVEAIRRSPWWVRGGGIAALVAGAVSLAVLPSKAEPVAMWERDFSRFDKNKDGKLDVGEANFPENLPDRSECPDPQVCDAFIEASNNIARAVFSERDADGNGIVTRAEFQANYASRYGNWFDTLDEPGNLRGYITLESLMALPKGGRRMGLYLWAQAPGGDAELQNAISVWASDSAEPVPELVAARIGAEFSRHDLDKDGRVTRVEFLTGVAY